MRWTGLILILMVMPLSASGGRFELRATIAQPDAGPTLSGGAYDLQGGFWTGAAGAGGTVFKDGFE